VFFPESPRYVIQYFSSWCLNSETNLLECSWLIDNNRPDEGLQTLARLHSHGDVNDPWVRAEYDQIQESITFEHEHEAKSYFELFTNRSSFRRLLIACTLQASIQMTGVSAIQYYSTTIYGAIGISKSNTLKYQAINNIIALLGEACCVLFIDKLGRRRPLIAGNLANMVSEFFYFGSFAHTNAASLGLFPHCLHLDCKVSTWINKQPCCILGFYHHVSPIMPLPLPALTASGPGSTTSHSPQLAGPCLGSSPPRSSTHVPDPRVSQSQPWYPLVRARLSPFPSSPSLTAKLIHSIYERDQS
jgi:hypothetical protein